MPGKLLIATHNPGKLDEFAVLLAPYRIETIGAAELGLPEPEETGDTFEANAALKARAGAEGSFLPALSDDSGLVVPAIGGDPGIYSARWAGEPRDFGRAMLRVRQALGDRDRAAHFVAVLALAQPGGEIALFRGEVHGRLTWPPRGDKGFGYDPMFIPDGYAETFGEIDPDVKHRISHRARAFEKLVASPLLGLCGFEAR
ncbi:MAG TPA: RdgB/HAM1 family non-canonical purine NTP pyrophosphatase [Stellaceae bacterium]|nr:RdgB/HAM1 family non-canonical purine NTP pyrophosphatase [Stellaceae bacterium]